MSKTRPTRVPNAVTTPLLAGILCFVSVACIDEPVTLAGEGADTGDDARTAADAPPTPDLGTEDSDRRSDLSAPDAGSNDLGPPDDGQPVAVGPTRYDPARPISELTTNVVDELRALRSASRTPNDAVFMKVGASGTVNSNFLDCLAASPSLAPYDGLTPTVVYFAGTDLAGQTSWDRDSLAAEVGRTANWAQTGAPSPLEQEIAAIGPRFALVNYGTNDMQQGTTHQTALWPFWNNMWSLLTDLMAQGIIPIVTGLNPRSDTVEAAYWVPTYNEVTRAMAQTLQLPYFDLYNSVVGLPSMGLVADGIHGNASPNGACRFDAAGLEYNYNVRNLATLRVLDAVRRTVVEGEAAPDVAGPGFAGNGTPASPYVIDRIPFAHDATTLGAASDALDAYPACDNGQNESGPEVVYVLELQQTRRLRAMVFDAEADVDVHHLAGAPDASNCRARSDKVVQGTFEAGTHFFVFDTYVSSSGELAGDYTMVVVECEAGDPTCG